MNSPRFIIRSGLLARGFGASESGASLMLFSLGIIPIMLTMAIGLDYARMASVESAVHAAADNAALTAASAGFKLMAAGNGNWNALGVQAGVSAFQASMGSVSGVKGTVITPTIVLTPSGSNVTAQVTYSVTPTTLMVGIGGLNAGVMSRTVSASTALQGATQTQLPYVNVDLVLDVSPSMAIGANAIDITNMQTATTKQAEGPCSFACHDNDDGSPTDNYTVMQNWNAAHPASAIQLRIDVVKSAAQTLTTYVTSQQNVSAHWTMGLYTMSYKLTTLLGATSNFASVSTAIGNVGFDKLSTFVNSLGATAAANIASGDMPDRYADSDFATTLGQLTTLEGTSGAGTSSAAPKKVVILVTDGLDDTGTAYNSSISPTYNYSYPQTQSFNSGNNWGKFTQPINPNWCAQMKANGVTVGVLYVTYVANPNDPTGNYQTAVEYNAPPSWLVTNLTNCASSPTLFYQATSATDLETDIATGLQSIFVAAATSQMVHLTQ